MGTTRDTQVLLEIDTSLGKQKLMDLQQAEDNFVRRHRSNMRQVRAEVAGTMMYIRSAWSMIRTAIIAAGGSLDAVFAATINAIIVSLEAILTMHRTLDMGTAGASEIVTVGLSIAVGALAWSNVVLVAQEQQKMRTRINASASIMEQTIGLLHMGGF